MFFVTCYFAEDDMESNGNTILITGGSTGIGLALAARFLRQRNEVIICGRRHEKLHEAQRKHPGLHVYRCDVSEESDRLELFQRVTQDFPKLNVLLNNAGMWVPTRLDRADAWPEVQQQLQTNLAATIHLTQLFAQHLAQQSAPVVFVTTSGLAHIPRAAAPVYCATKAALHSYALTLRHQFKALEIEVIEICPPHVDTDLGAAGINKAGIPVDTFADAVMDELLKGTVEITYGYSTKAANASRPERNDLFKTLNGV
jgi:uncharacterized oxidoreductase